MKLTKRQKQIFDFIRSHIDEKGHPPTVREIGEKFSLASTGSVRDHIDALIKKGYLEKLPGLARGLKPAREVLGKFYPVPVAGSIAAGQPELAIEDIEEHLLVNKQLAKDEKAFALRVKGNSMAGEGIMEGDYVIVHPQPTAEQGDIVAALIDDEATVKRFKRDGKAIKLVPANPSYPVIEVTGDITILGKVTGVVRYY